MLRSILINKMTTSQNVTTLLDSEQNLVKLLLQIEPNIWSEFATHWLYQTFMMNHSNPTPQNPSLKKDPTTTQSAHYNNVSTFILDKFHSNPNLALFN